MFRKTVGTNMNIKAAEFFVQYNQADVANEGGRLETEPAPMPGRFDVVLCRPSNPLDSTTIQRLRSESGAVNAAYQLGVDHGFSSGVDKMSDAWAASLKANRVG